MIRKTKSKKIPRRLLTATMSCVLMISLSSCSGASNYGNIDTEAVYASSGSYTVTNGELWNELKWGASNKIQNQIENIVVNDKINQIATVMNKKYTDLSTEEKEKYGSEAEYSKLKEKYETKLKEYVVQDIYNFSNDTSDFWKSIDDLKEMDAKLLVVKYVDELYTTYKIDSIGEEKIIDLVNNAEKDNDNLLTIANKFTDIYYPMYAKELFAEEKLIEEVNEANEEDDDEEDNNLGYFTTASYISEFKDRFINKNDVNMVLIRFNSEDEFNDTLRAFGIKVYNKQYYYVDGFDTEANKERSYKEYCEYYDDLSNSDLTYIIGSDYMLEIFIQIYNYLYSGYRTPLASGVSLSATQLDDLRTEITNKILNMDAEEVKANALAALENNIDELTYTRDDIDEISTSMAKYVYETLDLEDVNFSTSTQSYNSSYYIMYKFGEAALENEKYTNDLTDDEILEIITDEANADLKNSIQDTLIDNELTESKISGYVNEEVKEVKVSIYDEATEIAYSTKSTSYSKTLGKNKNKNVLAAFKYDGKKYNLNIALDENDENSLVIPGTDTKIGLFNILERESGQTTAIDILTEKMIKDTDAYDKTNEDRDLYKQYIEAILYNFANEGYASSGYSSSIGKYNFLMLYYHSSNIDDIIDNYYRIQYASVDLLVDYSSDKIVDFMKYYTDKAYDNYFSLSGTRLVVSFDGNDDTKADDIADWKDKIVTFDGNQVTLEYVAKQLVFDIYTEISASTEDHSSKLTSLVSEYEDSARVAFDKNPIVAENKWAKYKKLGLKIATEEYSATNSSVDIDFNLKQRLYDYSNPNGEYQYFLNETTPTVYIESLTDACVSVDNDTIVETNDGYNLILVTEGSNKPSAKWEKSDYESNLLENITIKYNENYVTVADVYNSDDKLTKNQIKLYLLENITSSSSNLTPTDVQSACTTFLSPVITRFTGDETQRQIVIEYIKNNSGEIKWTTEGHAEILNKILEINQNSTDGYNYLYEDTTNTSNSYPDWWSKLSDYLKEAK